jgi:hypothetical protein
MIDEQTRAAMVEEMCRSHYLRWDPPGPADNWTQCNKGDKALFRSWMAKDLTAAILAAEARGWKLTHREATEDMIEAAMKLDDIGYPAGSEFDLATRSEFRATCAVMHDAAPKWEDRK